MTTVYGMLWEERKLDSSGMEDVLVWNTHFVNDDDEVDIEGLFKPDYESFVGDWLFNCDEAKLGLLLVEDYCWVFVLALTLILACWL